MLRITIVGDLEQVLRKQKDDKFLNVNAYVRQAVKEKLESEGIYKPE